MQKLNEVVPFNKLENRNRMKLWVVVMGGVGMAGLEFGVVLRYLETSL